MRRLEKIIIPNLENAPESKCYWWDGNWYTRSDLLGLVKNCEDALKASCFGKGQRLVVMLRNCPLIPALSLAVWKLGGIFCPPQRKSRFRVINGNT